MMKTNITIIGLVAISLMACKKNEDSKMMKQTYATDSATAGTNNAVDSTSANTTSGDQIPQISYAYKATDGSRAKATFDNNGKSKTVTLEANNMKYVLDFKKATATGELYERNSISAETTPDSLFISQGNQVIHLGKEK
ncbi:MAG: hypothetical protein EOO18_00530 [Chryseobacterium sp.]|nr:MAG: hypothetical protein EOO18_00530 [Chryseobacterium sp.]